jgi:phosphate transport system protein
MMMKRHFERELEGLKTALIKLASHAEDAVRQSVNGLLQKNSALVEQVVSGDDRINSMEIEIDNAIVDLLALQQPVAADLRFILAAQKINNDLERIGDHAVNIAESAVVMIRRGENVPFTGFEEMIGIVEGMLRDAIDAFIHPDAGLAMAVLKKDDLIDQMNRQYVDEIVSVMKRTPALIDAGIELIRVSRNLERVADLATNIAEEVVFISQARVVKHHAEEKSSPTA